MPSLTFFVLLKMFSGTFFSHIRKKLEDCCTKKSNIPPKIPIYVLNILLINITPDTHLYTTKHAQMVLFLGPNWYKIIRTILT